METNADARSRGQDGPSSRREYLRRTAAIFGLGLVGIVGLAITTLLSPELLPSVADVPRPVLLAAVVVQPAALVLIAAAVGARLAPRLGFDSHALSRLDGTRLPSGLADEARIALPAGLGVGVLIVVLDVVFSSVVEVDATVAPSGPVTMEAVLAMIPLRFLYGGITEEVLLRWGFMTLLVWVGWRLTDRRSPPSRTTVWSAIVVSAVTFGVAHLPAAAASTALTPAVVTRIVFLNSVGGVVFGWVYWRYSLEAAMLAHAAAHVALLTPAIVAAL